jgi:tetratricopeptide (TPR) repeat protein
MAVNRLPLILAVPVIAAVLAAILVWRGALGPGAGSKRPVVAPYAGREACVECHEEESRSWQGSDHDLAMQPATGETVLGDFDDATFTHFSVTSRFFRRDGKFLVLTDGSDGALREFEIAYVFGVEPLQQYLIEFPGGRYQVLSLCWDTRPASEGGQRWFHLYPGEEIPHDDTLHWTGSNQNWNYMCAGCHSTDLQRNYDPRTDAYATTWAEIDVSCEACHGPASRHLAWAEKNPGVADIGWEAAGLTVDLGERRRAAWVFDDTSRIARRDPPAERSELVEVCAPCHSRRTRIHPANAPGSSLMSTHRPELLTESLYHADGQILDEVYVYGSFIQSKMYRNGVTCTDCHDAHSMRVYSKSNDLCARCHLSEEFDTEEHHFHRPGSPGAQCVDCHMPEKNYMVVDPRRDHSLRPPRPDLTLSLGVPNACNGCHQDRSAEWAGAQLDRRHGTGWRDAPHYGEAIHAGRNRLPGAREALVRLAQDSGSPGIARATALSLLADYEPSRSVAAIGEGLASTDPLIRLGAVYALAALEPRLAYQMGHPLLEDAVRTVRIETALVLAGTPDGLMTADQRAALQTALDEYREAQLVNAERHESHLNLGLLYMFRGELERAEDSYRMAIRIEPSSVAAYVNLADLYRLQQREEEGRHVLEQALSLAPDNAEAHHALGLLLVRQKRSVEAMEELRLSAELDPDNGRYAYIHGVALYSQGDIGQALTVLRKAHEQNPGDIDILTGLMTIHAETGRSDEAAGYARQLLLIDPQNPVATGYLSQAEDR